jgi:hypothetical protein
MNTTLRVENVGIGVKPPGVVDTVRDIEVADGGGDNGSVGIQTGSSNYKTKEQESGVITRDFVLFCEKVGLNVHDHDVSLKVCVLLSLGGVDVKSLGESMFPNVFIDWQLLSENERMSCRTVGTIFENKVVTWIRILQFFVSATGGCDDDTIIPEVLVHYQELMKQCKMNIELPDMARMFVLSSVNNQAMLETVAEYYRIMFPKENVGKRAQRFVGHYVDNRGKFERENYLPGIKWVLQNMHVSDDFRNEVRHFLEHRTSMQSRNVIRTVQLQRGRPCLRSRLVTLDVNQYNITNSTTSQETRDKFRVWCSRVRFPNNVCVWLRQKLYFVRCQRFGNEKDIERVLQEMVSHDVAKAVCECTIAYPDTDVIDTVITRMLFHRKPFTELLEFRDDAFTGFAQSRSQCITNPQIMQLYTCAYQHKSPWQEHWKKVIPVMNHTTITHVEKFVKTHPINMQEVLQTLAES